ncbi:MAG TPA: hypothetical protein V6D22_23395, partial [Candidatus Obscuribacterales bacterium]
AIINGEVNRRGQHIALPQNRFQLSLGFSISLVGCRHIGLYYRKQGGITAALLLTLCCSISRQGD